MRICVLDCAHGLEGPLNSVQCPVKVPHAARKERGRSAGGAPLLPGDRAHVGPRRRLPARPHPAGRLRRRAAGDKVAVQTPRPIAAQPAASSSLALARSRPGPAWCSGNVTAALVARVTASRPCLRIGAAARGPLRVCACARVCARVSVCS